MTDRRLRNTWITWIIAIALLALLPIILGGSYILHLLIISCIWIILAQGLNIILGYTGLLSLGQGGMFGIGAYVSALLAVKLGWSFWITMPLATTATALLGFIIGYPVLRTRGIYFAMVTLGLGVILSEIFNNWIGVTRGPMGIGDIPYPTPINLGFTSIAFDSKITYYYLVLAALILVMVVTYRIAKTTLGRALIAIKEDEVLAGTFGIFPPKFKIIAFTVCSAFSGLAGCLYAHYITFISPESFGVMASIDALVIVVVGSAGMVLGPALGTIILILVPEALRFASEYRMLVYAVILGVVIMYMPQGLGCSIGRLASKIVSGRRVANAYIGTSGSNQNLRGANGS